MSTDAALLKADEFARQRALQPGLSFIVQAPAGSGKTELLIQRYLTLLATVNEPEEILAITFTRKAAAEMQRRVLLALQDALVGSEPEPEHLKITYGAARAVLEQDKRRNWQLLSAPSRMRIQTLDSLNARLARTLPISSGLGGAIPIIADAEMVGLYEAAAVATLEDWLLTPGEVCDALENVIRHLDNNTSVYISNLSTMLAKRDQWLSIIGNGRWEVADTDKVRHQLEATIRNLVERYLQALSVACPASLRSELLPLADYAAQSVAGAEKFDEGIDLLAGMKVLPGSDDRERWLGMASLLLTKGGDYRKQVNKNQGFPPGDSGQKKAFTELLQGLAGETYFCQMLDGVRNLPPIRYSDEQWQVLLALFKLLPAAAAALRTLFSSRGITDHIEMALAARVALGSAEAPSELALLMDYKISHLLIDEMQDTSFEQYALIEQLTAGWEAGDGRTVFSVGDPMQSIYRFRNAEVGQFLVAQTMGIGSVLLERLVLRRNFRSGENLVHWFNDTFAKVFPATNDVVRGAIGYEHSVPVPMHAGLGELHIHPLFSSSRAAEADCGLRVIEQSLSKSEGSIAVLVRSRTQLPDLLERLRHAEIQYQAVEIDRLTDLPEIIDVLALTRALAHSGDRIAWLGLLRGPWVGLTWQDLHAIASNDEHATIWELLHDEARLAVLSPDGRNRVQVFVEVMQVMLKPSAVLSLRDRIERAWFALGGPALFEGAAAIENIYRFLDVVERVQVAGTLADVAEFEKRLDTERVSGQVSAECRLQVMTMHKAKGLQFDTVIIYGLGRTTSNSNPPVLNWLTLPGEDGENELILSPVGPRTQLEKDPLHQFIARMQKDKEQLELDRLLYVACTRAETQLHLIGNAVVTQAGESKAAGGSLLSRLWPAVADYYERAHAGLQEPVAEADEENFVVPVLKRLNPPWRLPDVQSLPATLMSSNMAVPQSEDEIDYYWVGSFAPHAGTVVHRWLQKMTDGEVAKSVELLPTLLGTTSHWLTDLGVQQEDLSAACSRVHKALRNALEDTRGRWLLEGEGYSEFALSGVIDGVVESVILDRVRIDENDVHWIVDYKTSTHEGGDLAGFLRQERDRYEVQLDKYRRLYSRYSGATVRTALYFPLLSEFLEVTIAESAEKE